MASVVEICNLALNNIRAANINSLNENSVQARTCKLIYPILRDQMLEDVVWQFARKQKPLSLLTEEAFNWEYVYQYPSDCLKINKLVRNYELIRDDTFNNQPVEYEVMDIVGIKVIVANESELRISYQSEIEDATRFPSQFVMALSHLMASEIAIPIVGAEMGRALRSDSLTIYEQYLAAAVTSDHNQQDSVVPDSEFVTIRN